MWSYRVFPDPFLIQDDDYPVHSCHRDSLKDENIDLVTGKRFQRAPNILNCKKERQFDATPTNSICGKEGRYWKSRYYNNSKN
jgi:hypothetical protein